jgi:hypothetical protein
MELDNQMLLVLAHPSEAVVEGSVLRLSGFMHGTWDWDEYGSRRSHLETFNDGQVEFFASPTARER